MLGGHWGQLYRLNNEKFIIIMSMWKLKKYVVRPIILSFLWPSLDQLEHTIVPNGNIQLSLLNNRIVDKVSV